MAFQATHTPMMSSTGLPLQQQQNPSVKSNSTPSPVPPARASPITHTAPISNGPLMVKAGVPDRAPVHGSALIPGQGFGMLPPHSRMGALNAQQNTSEIVEFGHNHFQLPYSEDALQQSLGGTISQQNLFLFNSNFVAGAPRIMDSKLFPRKSDGIITASTDNAQLVMDSVQIRDNLQVKRNHNPKVENLSSSRSHASLPIVFSDHMTHSATTSVITTSSSCSSSSATVGNASLPQGFARANVLRYQTTSGDAMLSAINYTGENDILQEGGFEVPVSTGFNSLDGLLSTGMSNHSGSSSIRLPDLLDGEVSQEGYIESSSRNLRLSPQSFGPGTDNSFGDGSSLGRMADSTNNTGLDLTHQQQGECVKIPSPSNLVSNNSIVSSSVNSLLNADKLKVKSRPVKATSPSGRPGTQPCPTCGKVFSNSSALTKHKLTHSDERKFVCQLCAKAFKRQDHLNGHMLTHRNKKPFECDVEGCGKSYCDARSLRRHKENHHTNSGPLSGGNTTAIIAMPTNSNSGSQLALIPNIPQLSLDSLQSAFSAAAAANNFVTNGSSLDPNLTTTSRIRYAPAFSQDSSTISQFLGSVLPTAASQLQFLAFHQPSSISLQQNTSQTNSPSQNTANELDRVTTVTSSTTGLQISQAHQSRNVNLNSSWDHPINLETSGLILSQKFSEEQDSNEQDIKLDQSSNVPLLDLTLCAKSKERLLSQSDSSPVPVDESVPGSELSDDYKPFQNSAPPSPNTLQSMMDYTNSNSASVSCIQETRTEHSKLVDVGPSDNTVAVCNISELSQDEQRSLSGGTPLLQQLLTPSNRGGCLNRTEIAVQQQGDMIRAQQNFSILQQQQIQQRELITQYNQLSCQTDNSGSSSYGVNEIPKPVECSICQRKFKNVPALNGHMRLHGGYFKKEGESKKQDRKPSHFLQTAQQIPTLQTASVNVRALIEEKIIQRQQRVSGCIDKETVSESLSNLPLNSSTCDLPFISEESYTLSIPDQPGIDNEVSSEDLLMDTHDNSPCDELNDYPQTQQTSDLASTECHSPVCDDSGALLSTINMFSGSVQKSISDLRQQFRVPRPVVEKHRRHSDSDHFLSAKKPCNDHISSAVANLLRRKVASRRTMRTGSDPGGDPNQSFFPCDGSSFLFDGIRTNHSGCHAESLPSTPTYRQLPELFPILSLPPDPGGNSSSHFSFLERDLVLSTLEPTAPTLPMESEFLAYNQGDNNLGMVVEEQSESLLGTQGSHGDEVFSGGDLMEGAYSSLCPNVNLLLDETGEPPHLEANEVCPGDPGLSTVIKQEKIEIKCDDHSGRNLMLPWPGTTDETDDDVFLSPTSIPASPIKAKRKHRPEPLFIPPHVNTGGGIFASRLRSPRLWDPATMEAKALSPPPYTPPPMLSPVRNGPGLFWHIHSSTGGNVTPKSAPITPNFLMKKISVSEELLEEEAPSDTPETDIQPHVNIGSQFQARLPKYRERTETDSLLLQDDHADQNWDPTVAEGVPDEDVEMYLEFACCASVPGSGRNKEYALHILQLTGGNIQEAIIRLMDPEPKLPRGHPLLSYNYSESDKWLSQESESFHQALIKCDKDFFSIAKEVGTKSVKQCIQFYYVWKKVCPEDYKRLRMLRRKREQEALFYNLRPKGNNNNNNVDNMPLDPSVSGEMSQDDVILSQKTGIVLPNGPSPASSPGGRSGSPASTAGETIVVVPGHFPCKICGKVFPKVKSRSAHMKSHRQIDNDKNSSNNNNSKTSFLSPTLISK